MTVFVFEDLEGKTLSGIESVCNEYLLFTLDDGEKYKFNRLRGDNEQLITNCITGKLSDLIDSPIILAEEIENDTSISYNLATLKGHCSIQWKI